jgi:SAM-dependent methyltransferase
MTIDTSDDLLWQQLKTLPAFRALLRAVEARFYYHVPLPEPTLDVGCGDGHFARMAFPGRRITAGVDPWWRPLQKSVRGGNYMAPIQALGDNLPFADDYFASAFSNSVLEHIPDIQPVLNEVSRVLRTGGRFLITMPSQYFNEYLGGAAFFERLRLPGLAGRYRSFFDFITRHAHTDSPETWAGRLALAGFAVERWQYYFSRDALRALEVGHVQGLPSAVLHALTGHWIVAPWESSLAPTERWVRPFFEEEASLNEGAYVMFVARKVATQPIEVHLPLPTPLPVNPVFAQTTS